MFWSSILQPTSCTLIMNDSLNSLLLSNEVYTFIQADSFASEELQVNTNSIMTAVAVDC